MQGLLSDRLVTAGHDRSDGGLLVTLLEMAFAGNCGLDVRLPAVSGTSSSSSSGGGGGDVVLRGLVDLLFSEELGLVLEVLPAHEEQVSRVVQSRVEQSRLPYVHPVNTHDQLSFLIHHLTHPQCVLTLPLSLHPLILSHQPLPTTLFQVLRAFAAARVPCVSIGRTGSRQGGLTSPSPAGGGSGGSRGRGVGGAGAAEEVARVTVRVGEVSRGGDSCHSLYFLYFVM